MSNVRLSLFLSADPHANPFRNLTVDQHGRNRIEFAVRNGSGLRVKNRNGGYDIYAPGSIRRVRVHAPNETNSDDS